MEGIAAHFIKLKPSVQSTYDGKTQMRKKNNPNIRMFRAKALLREEFL